ncbi:hypothetical protein ACHWQZ_G005070 [Mnemiopsis leidyi]
MTKEHDIDSCKEVPVTLLIAGLMALSTSKSNPFLKRNVSVHPMSNSNSQQHSQVLTQGPPNSIEIFKSLDSTVVVKRNLGGEERGNNVQNLNVCSSLAQINEFDENKPCWVILKGENSLGERVSRFISDEVQLNWDYNTVTVDCTTFGLEEWDEEYREVWSDVRNRNPTAFSITLPSPEVREKRLIEAMKLIDLSQGLILVTGEYNLSLPNTVRTLFESLPRSVYLGKPCAVVCYSPGICAGKRAGTQARAFLGEMSCLTIGSILALPQVHLTIDSDGKCNKSSTLEQLRSVLQSLSWYSSALSAYRKQKPPHLLNSSP